jgi:hypothetical protein|tara:strand:- start:1169 stop:1747 length:579 start_codon:yes stop_codon:yes gene_type:complete
VSTIKVDAIQGTSGASTAITLSGGVVTFSQTPVGAFIAEADMFRFTSNLINTGDAIMTGGFERVDDATFAKIGTGMTESSGAFTFPRTGLYRVAVSAHLYIPDGNDGAVGVNIKVSSNSGSSYDTVAVAWAGNNDGTAQWYGTHPCEAFVNVTNASTFRVAFFANSSSDSYIVGDTDRNQTSFSFIRLGESQ